MSESESLQICRFYEFSVFNLDVNEGLFVGGEPVKLAPKVLQTLTLFVENPGRIITKDEFFEKIWTDSFVEDGALSFNISRLRKALAEFDKDTEFIETVSKRGFRFIADVRKVQPEESTLEILIERHQVKELVHEEERLTETETRSKFAAIANSRIKIIGAALAPIVILAGLVIFNSITSKDQPSSYSFQSEDKFSWKSAGSTIYSESSASHNGVMIAYSSTENGDNSEIYLRQFNGNVQPITKDGWDNHSPVWSPNDEEIAYVSDREGISEIYRCPFLCKTPKLVQILGDSSARLVSWSKNGPAIFYELEGNLFRITVNDTQKTQITDFTSDKLRHFAISPDEQKIAYRDITDGQSDIWIKTLEGGAATRLTNDPDEESDLKWHPDGERLFYSVQRDDLYPISVISIGGGEPVQLTYGEGKFQVIDVLPDGKEIIYKKWQEKFDISTVEISTGEERKFASELGYEYWAEPSPDGRSIAYQMTPARFMRLQMYKSSVLVRDIQSGDTPHAFRGFGHRWLPDGRRIAFFRKQEDTNKYDIWLFDTVNASETRITFEGAGQPEFPQFPFYRSQVTYFDWSRNSDRIAYLENGIHNVIVASPADGNHKVITNGHDPKTGFFSPIWSPDGNRLLYLSATLSSTPDQGTRWRVCVYEEGISKVIYETTSGEIHLLGWSSSGNEVFAETANGAIKAGFDDVELLRIPVSGGETSSRTFVNISPLSMTLSPDKTEVAYISRTDGREAIYRHDIADNIATRVFLLSEPDTHLGSISWSPDGKSIFMDKQEEINIIFFGTLNSNN